MLDELVAFWVHAALIERVCGVADPKEARALLKGFGAEAADFGEFFARLKGAILLAVGNDVTSDGFVETRYVGKQLFAGGVHLDANLVHTGDHGVVECALECVLIDVVLILPDAN